MLRIAGATGGEAGTIDVSVVVPALNEAANLPLLLPRIDASLRGRSYEVLVVDDDSHDGTPRVAAELALRYPVRLITRTLPDNGLSGAVLLGLGAARGAVLVVMDADLQHPPERIPDLVATIESGAADFAIGSRYVAGGTTQAGWGIFRQLNSRLATLLARPFAGRTRDPMSGFFALARSTFRRGQYLTPVGYKVGLELMCKCGAAAVREVPIHFANRSEGVSKLSGREQAKYLEHLSRLYDFCFPRAAPMVKFATAASIGWAVGLGAFGLLNLAGAGRIFAPLLAYLAVLSAAGVFHGRYVRTQCAPAQRQRRWLDFAVVSLAEWLTCGFAAVWVAARVAHASPVETLFLTFGAATVARYVLRKEFFLDLRGVRRDARYQVIAREEERAHVNRAA